MAERGNIDVTFDALIVRVKAVADKLNPIAMRIDEQFKLYGLRAKINFKCLLKCLAYRNNRKTVTDEEFKEFLELADFMNLDLNPI
jgi:hypothetical protein